MEIEALTCALEGIRIDGATKKGSVIDDHTPNKQFCSQHSTGSHTRVGHPMYPTEDQRQRKADAGG